MGTCARPYENAIIEWQKKINENDKNIIRFLMSLPIKLKFVVHFHNICTINECHAQMKKYIRLSSHCYLQLKMFMCIKKY